MIYQPNLFGLSGFCFAKIKNMHFGFGFSFDSQKSLSIPEWILKSVFGFSQVRCLLLEFFKNSFGRTNRSRPEVKSGLQTETVFWVF